MTATDSTYLQRACPACGSQAVADQGHMASEPRGEDRTFPELRSSWRGFFQERKLFFTYVRCAACGQVYCPHYFTPSQLAELYGQMDDNTAGLDEAMLARAQRGYWKLAGRFAPLPRGSYVEFGPDIGLFTREAMAHPAFDFCWLVEPNTAVHPALDRLLNPKPHTIFDRLEQVGQIPDGSVSLAVAIHVLDHLLEPREMLEQLVRKLAPGGVVLATTRSPPAPSAHAGQPGACSIPSSTRPAPCARLTSGQGWKTCGSSARPTIFRSAISCATFCSRRDWAASRFRCPPRGWWG
jgi:hypothetical protein